MNTYLHKLSQIPSTLPKRGDHVVLLAYPSYYGIDFELPFMKSFGFRKGIGWIGLSCYIVLSVTETEIVINYPPHSWYGIHKIKVPIDLYHKCFRIFDELDDNQLIELGVQS